MVAVLQQLASSKSVKYFSDWSLKVWKIHLVIRTSQDTNNWHLQQGSLEVCDLYSWFLEFWPIEARRQSSNVSVSRTIPFRYFKSTGRSAELEVLQQRGNRTLWSEEWKDTIHSWVPRVQRKHPCAHKVLLPLLFDLQHRFEATTSSGTAKTSSEKSQQHQNSSVAKSKHLSRCTIHSAKIAETAKTLSTSMFWSNTTCNLCLYTWRTSPKAAETLWTACSEAAQLATCAFAKMTEPRELYCFYSFIALNSATVLWVRGIKSIEIMAAFDEQLLFSKQSKPKPAYFARSQPIHWKLHMV